MASEPLGTYSIIPSHWNKSPVQEHQSRRHIKFVFVISGLLSKSTSFVVFVAGNLSFPVARARVCVCVRACVRVCMRRACVCLCTRASVRACMHAYMRVCACMCMCVCVCEKRERQSL